MLKLEVKPYTLDFKFSARTSRGEIKDRQVWFVRVSDEVGRAGVGEVAPIRRLSPEDPDDIIEQLNVLSRKLESISIPKDEESVFSTVQSLVDQQYPSIRFALEMAVLDLLNGGDHKIFEQNTEEISIPINGLVWMGDVDFMKNQIREKLDEGFQCIKLKVGALDFETELEIIKNLRKVSSELVIRLDANGGFQTNEVLGKLKRLSVHQIHSIEQPILPMQPEAMELVCKKSDIPIALDEELIHVFAAKDRMSLIQELKPNFLVLKPTLHGGFSGVREWIDLAEMHGIGWWITSYLESNVGLNAIAQFANRYNNREFHGLGTGHLYHNNIESPVLIDQGRLRYAKSNVWGEIDFAIA